MIDNPRNWKRLGQILRKQRIAKGLRLRDVAAKVGLTPTVLSHIEAGYRVPTVAEITAMASFLEIDLSAGLTEPKLIRDGIPDQMRSNGYTPTLKHVYGKEKRRWLLKKLVEESNEALESDGDYSELGDVYSVLEQILRDDGKGMHEIAERAFVKKTQFGAFDKGYLWMNSDDPSENAQAAREKYRALTTNQEPVLKLSDLPEELADILLHALGKGHPEQALGWRHHYCAAPGDDNCQLLVDMGFLKRPPARAWLPGSVTYYVTAKGKRLCGLQVGMDPQEASP